ncbi:MAG: hypothetical protein ACLRMZ_16480 [Blautia marasmi]
MHRSEREREEAEKAARILQLDYFAMLDFPDAGVYFQKKQWML